MNEFANELVEKFVKNHEANFERYRESLNALNASYLTKFERKFVEKFVKNHEANFERYRKITRYI